MSLSQQKESPDQVYRDLKSSVYWTHPEFSGKIDLNAIKTLADDVKPYELRVFAIPALGPNFVKNGAEERMLFAKYVEEKKLQFGDKGIMIVLTRKGISAYNQRLTANELVDLSNTSKKLATRADYTPAIRSLATGVRDLARSKGGIRPTQPATTTHSPVTQSGGSGLGLLFCIGIPVALAAGVAAIMFGARKQKINQSKKAAEETKVKALNAMTFIDSYDGLLKNGQDADSVRQYRDRMGETFDEGMARLRNGRTVADFDLANNTFVQVLSDFENAKGHINSLTSGAGVAFTIPPIIDNQRAPLFEPMQGVSYFSSQPSDQLIPVEVNFGGTRKTVMVTPQERDELLRGNMPQLRGQYNPQGQFMPWYAVQGYDPYRDYNSHSFIWDVIAISAISNMFAPHYGYGWGGGLFGGGYGGYGYGHGDTIINNYYDQNPGQAPYSNTSGDFDTGSSGAGGDYTQTSGDFDTSSGSSDSGSSGGDFDFGGGGSSDSGGGGFDFGGGGDSGGGFDSGGGDF